MPWQLSASTTAYTLTNFLSGATRVFNAQGTYVSDADAYGNRAFVSLSGTVPLTWTAAGGWSGPSSRTMSLTSTAGGLLSDVQSPLWRKGSGFQGQRVTYGYNGSNQLISLAHATGSSDALTTTFGYSGTQLTHITTPFASGAHIWSLSYDSQGRVSSITSPVSGTMGQAGYTPAYTTTFQYTPNQTQVVEGYGSTAPITTLYTLDAQGEPIAVTDALNHTSVAFYDADHDVITSTDALYNTTSYIYTLVGPSQSVGLLTQVTRPAIRAYTIDNQTYTPVTTTYRYDPSTYNLLEADSGEGGRILYGYNAFHDVITTTQLLTTSAGTSSWRASVASYDPYGELTGSVDGRGVSVPPTTGSTTPMATLNGSALSYTTSYTYTPSGDLAKVSTPPIVTMQHGSPTTAPVTVTYGYGTDGNLTALTPANNVTTTYSYNHLMQVTKITQPSVTLWTGSQTAPVETLGYDGDGNLTSATDGAGDRTQASYDPLGRLVATINPLGATALYTYTATSLSAVRDAALHVTSYSYDPTGRRTSTTDGTGATIRYNVDAMGNTVGITTPLDYNNPSVLSLQSLQYNALNALSSSSVQGSGEVTPTVPQTTTYAYDHDLNPTQIQIAQDGVSAATTAIANSYDLADRLSASSYTTQPAGVSAGQSTRYDLADNPTAAVDFNLYSRGRSFDGDNRLTTQVDSCAVGCSAPALTTATSYDPNGNMVGLSQQTAGLGQTAAYTATYNPVDWLNSQDNGQGATTYGYDAAGRVRSISSQNGTLTRTRTVDAAGRVQVQGETVTDTISSLTPTPTVVASPVPPPGTATPTASPTATATSTSCAGLSNPTPTATTTPTTVVTSTSQTCFTYTADDQPSTASLPNGAQEARSYDAAGRLTTLNATTGLASTSPEYWNQFWVAQRNPLGSTIAITTVNLWGNGQSGNTATFGYNALGQLAAAFSPLTGYTYQWSYDALGNVTQEAALPSVGTTSYQYGAAAGLSNQLLSTSGMNVASYGYDASGNTTAITTGAGTTTLAYTAQGRVSQMQEPDGNGGTVSVQMTYNARGLRDSLSVTPATGTPYTERFSYQGDRVSQVGVTGPLTFTESFLYRPNGQPLELLYQQPLQPTQRFWYVLDLQGNVVGLSDATGKLVNQYWYDAWGAMDPQVAPEEHSNETILQPLRYRGYWYDGWYNGSSTVGPQPHLAGSRTVSSGAIRTGTRLRWPAQRRPLPPRMGLSMAQWRALPATLRTLYQRALARRAHMQRGQPVQRRRHSALHSPVQPHVGGSSSGTDAGPIRWYWLSTRYYDPVLRRFLQPDPSSQDGVRSYVYCHDDPANCADPSGLTGGGEQLENALPAPSSVPAGDAEPPSAALSSDPSLLDTTAWGPAIPYQDTIDAVSAELGSEPIATLAFADGWQKTVPETDPPDTFVYIVFDSDTDVIMKPGQTAGSRYSLIARFRDYARTARKLRLTSQLRLALWDVPAASGRELDATETRVRDLLQEMGHRLPWENDRTQRLKRPGSGLPFFGNDGRGIWIDDPQNLNHGQFRNRTSGEYYQQDPPYYPHYPPWTPDPAE